MAVKFSSANLVQVTAPDNDSLTLPNSDWYFVFFMKVVANETNFQYIFSNAISTNVAESFHIVWSSTTPADNYKLIVYLDTLGTSGVVLKSSSTITTTSGWIGVMVRRLNNILTLHTCPILTTNPTNDSAVVLQATFATPLSKSFNSTSSISIGNRVNSTNRYYNQELFSLAKGNGTFQNLDFAKYCYGTPLEDIGFNPSFYIKFNNATDYLDQKNNLNLSLINSLTTTTSPSFGYVPAGTNALTITGGYQDNRIYVLDNKNTPTYEIPINCSWSGETPFTVQARVYNSLGNTILQDWYNPPNLTINGNGTISGTVTVNAVGGKKRLQIRTLNSLSVLILETTIRTEVFGIGLFCVLLGSSSSVYLLENSTTLPVNKNSYMSQYTTGNWLAVNTEDENVSGTITKNPVLALAKKIYEETGLCTLIGTLGITGSTAAEWSVNNMLNLGTWYNINTKISFIILTVGSNDAASNTIVDYDNFYNKFQLIIQKIRNATNSSIPIFIHGSAKRNASSSPESQWNICRQVERDIGIQEQNVYYASNPIDKPTRDGIHLTTRAFFDIMYQQTAPNILRVLNNLKIIRGAYISHVKYKDNYAEIYFPFKGNLETPTSGFTGFSFSDNSGSLTVLTNVLESPSKIKITFNRNVIGQLNVSYLSGHNPNTSVIFYNGFYPSEVYTNVKPFRIQKQIATKLLNRF